MKTFTQLYSRCFEPSSDTLYAVAGVITLLNIGFISCLFSSFFFHGSRLTSHFVPVTILACTYVCLNVLWFCVGETAVSGGSQSSTSLFFFFLFLAERGQARGRVEWVKETAAPHRRTTPGKRLGFLYSIFSSLGINRQLPIPFFPTPWPSAELKHTLLARVPVGAALWGVEVVSEWRLREMVTAGC